MAFTRWSIVVAVLASLPFTLANSALDYNTNFQNNKHVQIAITVAGSDFYYFVCANMGFTGIAILGVSMMKPRSDRVFFYLCAAILMVACIAYYAMGSNLGWTPIDVEFNRPYAPVVAGRNREIFYVRYIDWVITTPLLLTDLLLTAGVPWPTIIWTILLDEVMVVTGLVGALTKTRYKVGFFAFGSAAMFTVFYELAFVSRRRAAILGKDVHRVFLLCGVLTLVVWCGYPIAWGICEGGNVISPDGEAVFYGCLDLCAKPLFRIFLILGHWKIAPARLGLHIADYDSDFAVHEKKHDAVNGNGATNGVMSGANDAGTNGTTTEHTV